jgi:hypothetical protein
LKEGLRRLLKLAHSWLPFLSFVYKSKVLFLVHPAVGAQKLWPLPA